jgi:hypothetical protein
MRVSEHYNLGRTQPTLDFVDVDIHGDLRVYVDPRALRLLPTTWGAECVSLIQDFFQHVLRLIRAGQHQQARTLLARLREPNEVHLGLSRERARGSGLGDGTAHEVWEGLSRSEAVETGLLEDLEDTILMVPGIADDRVSDISVNLMRGPLIRYTQEMAEYHGVPLVADVDSGPLWDPMEKEWYSEFVSLPMTPAGKLLLVPKGIVRHRMTYDLEEYYRHYLLEYLQDLELNNPNSELVELLRDGRRRVTKKALVKKYGRGKLVVVRETREHPDILRRYRRDKEGRARPALSHEDLAESTGTPPPDWDSLLAAVHGLEAGADAADEYERAIESLLTALFYPDLTHPHRQRRIHEGRKRIDIDYTNGSQRGFFFWLGHHHPAPRIFVECKNYNSDLGNPELDQLAGRFSPTRGKVGLLVCRRIADKERFLQRCRDTAGDDRGFIIALDDEDLATLIGEVRANPDAGNYGLLRERFRQLTD